MNVEAWEADAVVPPVTLPDALVQAVFAPVTALTRGSEPGEVVILVEIDVYAG